MTTLTGTGTTPRGDLIDVSGGYRDRTTSITEALLDTTQPAILRVEVSLSRGERSAVARSIRESSGLVPLLSGSRSALGILLRRLHCGDLTLNVVTDGLLVLRVDD